MTHMHYTGTGIMHSFRGQVPNEAERKIRIQGSVGAIAWRITKFEIINGAPGASAAEGIVKIYRESQSSIDALVNFEDDELLAVAYWEDNDSVTYNHGVQIIFDNALFVRNIYVTNRELTGATAMNYYIELEEVKVSKAGMAQLAVAAARRREER